MPGTASYQSASVVAAEYKGKLLVTWDDGDTFRGFEKLIRNPFIRCVHDLPKDLGSFVHAVNVIFAIRSDRR